MTLMRTKLSDAFEHLWDLGVIAEENFTCCQNCGIDQAYEYAREINVDTDTPMLGYCFYHWQDREDRDARGHFHLSFGAFSNGTETAEKLLAAVVKVGELVCAVLRDRGVEVEWDGDPRTRIKVIATTGSEPGVKRVSLEVKTNAAPSSAERP
jgi:hypothetical protein